MNAVVTTRLDCCSPDGDHCETINKGRLTHPVKGVSLFENKVDVRSFGVGPKWFRDQNLSWPWWEFRNEGELLKVLDEILDIVFKEGLELLEREAWHSHL